MRVLVTAADEPLGAGVALRLRENHVVRLTGAGPLSPPGLESLPYTPLDLREEGRAADHLAGVDAVVHCAPHSLADSSDDEATLLDQASRATFVLLHAALKAGVKRFVVVSRLEVMDAYPAEYIVDPTWSPKPAPNAQSLAPHLAELTVREFVRAEPMLGVCLRMGALDGPDGTSSQDARTAIEAALAMDVEGRKNRWFLYHICSTDRYPLAHASSAPLHFTRSA